MAALGAWTAQKPTQSKDDQARCKAIAARKDLPKVPFEKAALLAAMDAALPGFVLPDPVAQPEARAHMGFFMGFWEARRWALPDRRVNAFDAVDHAEYNKRKFLGEAQWKPEGLAALVDIDTPHAVSLKANGEFFCLNRQGQACHGMDGKPCVHLVASVMKLSLKGDLPWAWLHQACATPKQDPSPETKARLTGWLLAQLAGQPVDWRPTEAIPEDIYAG